MAKRKISVNPFSQESIRNAQIELQQAKYDIERMFNALIEALTHEGAEYARARVIELGAVMTGELADSIEGFFSPKTNTGIIKVSADHGIFVEFGTGVVGSNNPHPESNGAYRKTGWWYWNDYSSNWVFTEGMASRPFMYETWKYLTNKVRGIK